MASNSTLGAMSFSIPRDLVAYLHAIDDFIIRRIAPLQASNDNERFFDHRREHSRTDWDHQGLPRDDWEELLAQARNLADEAGFYRFCLPEEFGGKNGSNLWMAVIRMHLARKGLGLFNDLQNEHSVVGNFPDILMVKEFGTEEQKREFIQGRLGGKVAFTFGLTEPNHGSDATHMFTHGMKTTRDGVDGWIINGSKMWISGIHRATHCLVFARTNGKPGDAIGITAFFVPKNTPGFTVESYEWTFNMPTDHATLTFTDVFVPDTSILGVVGHGLAIAQTFVHENRLRQAASSLGAAEYCIEESIKYARTRKPFGKELSANQAVQFPIVELSTQAEMLKLLILKTATEMDGMTQKEIEQNLGDKVSMCNYWGNRLCTEAADRAMQIHGKYPGRRQVRSVSAARANGAIGGIGYSRHKAFEHIYRHHRRYRITEGSEEIQMRKIAAYLFGYVGPRKVELSRL